MASSHDTPLIDRVYAAASHLHHLNKPVPHFLMDVHDAMIPYIETLQTTLEDRGWASVSLPPFLSTLQARLAITGVVIAFGIFLAAAALPRGGSKNEKAESKNEEEAEMKVSVVEEVVGEAGVEKQEIRREIEVEVELKQEEREQEEKIALETEPVPASSKLVSMAAEFEEPAAPAATPASPPREPTTTTTTTTTTTATPASPVRAAPVSKKESKNSVDPRSPRPEPAASYRTSPIRTRSCTSSIPVRVPTTPARASSYPIALNTAVNKNASTPARKTASPTTSPASAKVVAASYAWVMSEGLEWDDGGSGSETEGHSYNSGSHSDDDDDDKNDSSSPRSRKSLEDELSAAGYAGGRLDNDSASEDDENDDNAREIDAPNGALHPRRHSHTSDIEARYEEWRRTRASQHAHHHHHHGKEHRQKSMTSHASVGGFVGGVRKTRSHHSRKDSVLE